MTFENIIKDYKDFYLNTAINNTNLGFHTKDDDLDVIDYDFIKNETNQAKQILDKLNSIDKESLSFEEQIDGKLIEMDLQMVIFKNELKYNDLYDYEQKPRLGHYLINSMLYLFIQDPRDEILRINAINSRIEKMPQVIQKYQNIIKKSLSRWKAIEIEELNGLNELFESIIEWGVKINFQDIQNLKINIIKSKKAIQDYIKFIENIPNIDNFHIGIENAQKLINLNGIDYNIDQLYNIAKNFYEENTQRISALKERLIKKYNLDENLGNDEVIKFIKEKFSIPTDKILDEYKNNQDEIIDYLNNKKLFVYPKDHRLLIMKTPAYLIPSIPVGAMFPPSAFEKGPKTSLIYLTIDENRQSDQNLLMIKNTMIHEGIPGHHLQLSMAYENKSEVRRLYNNNVHAEGWTTYLEGLMTEIGFIGKDIRDEYEIIALSDFARLGARVSIDLYFLSGDEKYLNIIEGYIPEGNNPFEKAKNLLIKITNFTQARAEGELNWYSLERGYPMCYLIGNKITWELQKYILGNYENKEEGLYFFHKTYLEEGNLPPVLLKNVFQYKLNSKQF